MKAENWSNCLVNKTEQALSYSLKWERYKYLKVLVKGIINELPSQNPANIPQKTDISNG